MIDFVVVKQHPSLLMYVDDLQRKNAEALSFYPLSALEREAALGCLYLAMLNGEPCGYIYRGRLGIDVRLHQVCIQYDARRALYGAALVRVMESDAEGAHASSVTLRCGFDLDANVFWKSLGYSCVAVKDGGGRRMRRINVWRKALQPTLFPQKVIEPAVGKTNSRLYYRHRDVKAPSRLARGKSESFRALLIEAAASKDSPSG